MLHHLKKKKEKRREGKNKKGQINVTDLFIAVFIFCILITAAMLAWNKYNEKIIERTEYYNMMTKTFQISNTLVKTPGYPTGWTADNVKIIGLASEDRILSKEKVDTFTTLDINKTKGVFQTYGYNFYFTLKTNTGNITYGQEPNGKKSVSITRYVLFENEKAIMDFRLWK